MHDALKILHYICIACKCKGYLISQGGAYINFTRHPGTYNSVKISYIYMPRVRIFGDAHFHLTPVHLQDRYIPRKERSSLSVRSQINPEGLHSGGRCPRVSHATEGRHFIFYHDGTRRPAERVRKLLPFDLSV